MGMYKEVFICYETETGLDYAKHLKKALEKIDRSAFVAHEDGEAGEQLQEAIDGRIKACKYFVVIVTVLAIDAKAKKEVKREIKVADSLPHLKRNIIICKEESVDRSRLSELPRISGFRQIDFESKEELARKVITEIRKKETQIAPESVPHDIYRLIDRLTGD